MKINRVHLKDYRIHENNEFIFDRGINLILGKNGSGKSSILEALGLAMFDADIRSNITDAVRYGQKTAVITVEFEGNDDNTYVVERKIGQVSSFKLSLKGESAARINGKEQVLSKIKELANITANERSLFQNVITAYQNKITGIFEEKPTRREIIFNQIFDTAIYREMYEQFLKQARDEYQQQIALKNQSISDLLAKLKDTSQLKKELREKTALKDAEEKKLNKLKKEVRSIEKACGALENLKRKIDSAQSDFKHNEQMKEAKLNELKKTQSALNESTNSLSIVQENEENYKAYEEKNTLLQKLDLHIVKLEEKEKELLQQKETLNRITLEEKEAQTRSEQIVKQLTEDKTEFEKKSADLKLREDEFETLCKEQNELSAALKRRKELTSTFSVLYRKLLAEGKKLNDVSGNVQILQKQLLDVEETQKEITELQKNKEILLLKKEERAELERQIGDCITRLNVNLDAEEQLQGGICPFLNEDCLNIMGKGSVKKYFLEINDRILGEKNKLLEQLNNYEQVDNQLNELEKSLAVHENQIHKDKEKRHNIELLQKDAELFAKNSEVLVLKIKELLQPAVHEFAYDIEQKNLEQAGHNLRDTLVALEEKHNSLTKNVDEKKKSLQKYNEEKNAIGKKIEENEQTLQREAKKIEQSKNMIASITEKITVLESKIFELPALKQERMNLSSTLSTLRQGHELYVSNRQKAGELQMHQRTAMKLDKELNKINHAMDKSKEKLNKYLHDYSEAEYEKKKNELRQKKSDKEIIEKRVSEITTECALKQKELDDNKQLEAEHDELNAIVHTLSEKLKLAEHFRNKVESMGKFVAGRLLQQIEVFATENYHSITGRSEQIKWVNDERESYVVYLTTGHESDTPRKFEVLSGGEQVAVALSIRAAMASILTRAQFVIFDEPTINLDLERKQALADSLKEMMRDLKQAIIVTHDDTFMEMAQKIIQVTGSELDIRHAHNISL